MTTAAKVPGIVRGRPFAPGHDPRRNLTTAGTGRPAGDFRATMRALASSPSELAQLEAILTDHRHPHFVKAFALVCDRAFGKATLHVEVPGSSIEEAIKRARERLQRYREEDAAREANAAAQREAGAA